MVDRLDKVVIVSPQNDKYYIPHTPIITSQRYDVNGGTKIHKNTVTLGCELAAPEILPYEIGNALSAAVKRRRVTSDEALLVYQCTMEIPVELRTVAIGNALEIACVNNIYAYDAYFLECALGLRAPLLTLDMKMREVAQRLGIKILEVGS